MKPIRFYSGCSKKKAYAVLYAGLILLLLILVACNICIGSVNIPLSEVVSILGGKEAGETVKNIILQIRFPRALAAVILGGALALSGYLLQTFFHNPLAGPFVLGISSGAKLVVALVMVFFLGNALKISSFALILAAFAGAMISMGFVLLISKKLRQMSMLVVSGVMIGYICSAVTDFVVTFADDSDIVNLHNWSMGSFSGISWGNIRVMSVVVLLTGAVTFFLSKPLGARGILCEKYGSQHPAVPRASGTALQYFVRVCDRVCRSGVLCRDRGSAAHQKSVSDGKTDPYDPGVLFGWRHLLSVL